jgi:hypothetical protein
MNAVEELAKRVLAGENGCPKSVSIDAGRGSRRDQAPLVFR